MFSDRLGYSYFFFLISKILKYDFFLATSVITIVLYFSTLYRHVGIPQDWCLYHCFCNSRWTRWL